MKFHVNWKKKQCSIFINFGVMNFSNYVVFPCSSQKMENLFSWLFLQFWSESYISINEGGLNSEKLQKKVVLTSIGQKLWPLKLDPLCLLWVKRTEKCNFSHVLINTVKCNALDN